MRDIMKLIEESIAESDNFHSHRCACGHEWAHSDSCMLLPTLEHDAAHTCAKCGATKFTKHQNILSKASADHINGVNDELD